MRPMSATTNGVQASQQIVLDAYGWPNISLQVVVTGSATYTVQQTLDLPGPGVTQTWFDHPDPALVGATTNKQGNYAFPPVAVRLNQTAGTGRAVLTVVQAGGSPA